MTQNSNLRLSDTARSNLFTMGVCASVDARQKINEPYAIPPAKVRELRARLILEEALETCYALGVVVAEAGNGSHAPQEIAIGGLTFSASDHPEIQAGAEVEPDLEGIIDGCCDTIYVCVGTLVACGIPDLPHLAEVNRANNDKFPNGVAMFNEHGKFQKPKGWRGPDHAAVREEMLVEYQNGLQSTLCALAKIEVANKEP